MASIRLARRGIEREGSDVSVISHSDIFVRAEAAAAELAAESISVEPINLRTISPWDRETVIASVCKTGRSVDSHEAVRPHGVGAEITAVLQEELSGAAQGAGAAGWRAIFVGAVREAAGDGVPCQAERHRRRRAIDAVMPARRRGGEQ